jgi:hypothetical protein
MHIIAIDPGPEKSAYLRLTTGIPTFHVILPNEDILKMLAHRTMDADVLVIEMVASYGMAVGKSVFETCVWIGRFIQASPCPVERMYRMAVKMHLCHDSRAKDGNIRQAIIDRYPATGGGKCPQIGTKKNKGPLYGVSKDVWSALALAITYNETQSKQKET